MAIFHRKKVYDIIYSLGSSCAAATYLNRHFLRVTSGPFDWCSVPGCDGSFGERLTHLLCSRFSGFLEKENIELAQEKMPSYHDEFCDLYFDKGSGYFLPHEFPIGEPMEQHYEKVKAKYERRIARFYDRIQHSERVLLVWICYGKETCDEERLLQQCRLACEAFGKTVDFLLIYNDDSMGLNQPAVKQQPAPHIDLWRANIRRAYTGAPLDYLGASHLIDPIFRGYALKGTQWLALKARLRSKFGRVLSSFIPVRTWRRQVRARFIYNEFNHDFFQDLRNRG